MYRPRIIPVLLLKNLGLVKTTKFGKHRYIGDPINAVKIYNDLKADELVFLDITASRENRKIPISFVEKVGDEANMPFAVGGGIKTIADIREIINAGAEKVIINTNAVVNPLFIQEAANEFGSSTIVVSIDVKTSWFNKEYVYSLSGTRNTKIRPVEFAQQMEQFGAGEIIINSINHDGMMQGYNINLIKRISESISIPVVAVGGAGGLNDFKLAVDEGFASAVGAGSLFVFHGKRKAVLISYPAHDELINIF